jgi:dTDP-4-dehydrorhamnose 3,5-epimerase
MTTAPVLNIIDTPIPAVKIIEPKRFGDHRGFFSETYNRASFLLAGIDLEFMQDNHSLSETVGTLRGLHFQLPPFAQDKLVRVTRGRILDVAVDIRRSSPTYGNHVAVELSAENWKQLLVPKGFAHGFITLEQATEVLYKVTAPYSFECDRGLRYDDPDLMINWPIPSSGAVLSDKDTKHPSLADLPVCFP